MNGPNPSAAQATREPNRRFANRAENYVRYRPRYPAEIIDLLRAECGLLPDSRIADIGSGTGFLAELFLRNGNRVYGIEPNKEMREAGEELLRDFAAFTSLDGTAEATPLPNASADFVTAGQAFHWFDRLRCRLEFKRILAPGGWVVLVWNDRRTDSTPFLAEYERLLLEYSTEYHEANHRRMDALVFREFFGFDAALRTFPNFQHFDFTSLKGRLLSSSYVPEAGEKKYDEMLDALKRLYEMHQVQGRVCLEYDAVVHYGRLG